MEGPDPFPILLRASLLLGLVPGFGLGLILLLSVALRLSLPLDWLALVQVHGQVQAVGFVALFIFGAATVLVPRFLASPLRRPGLSIAGGLGLATGLVLRSLAQPAPPSPVWSVALGLSAVLELGGLLLYAAPLLGALRVSVQPRGLWQAFLGTAFASLFAALVLNAVAVAWLIGQGQRLVPVRLDEAILHLELWGFAVPVILVVSLRIIPRFLLLRPPVEAAIVPILGAYACGVALVSLAWLVPDGSSLAARSALVAGWALMLAAAVAWVAAVRLYEPAVRPSGMPHVTYPTRWWVRAAYVWLPGAALLGLALAIRPLLGGSVALLTEASAQRHALAMGFVAVMIVTMAARILPVYSGWALYRPRLVSLMTGLLLVGAVLRVGGELVGGYADWAAPLLALGGTLGVLGFILFAATVWPTLGRESVPPRP